MADPSPEQQKYIDEASTRSLLLAAPGSGKTKTGVRRFLHRCKQPEPGGVAYLSFTRVAIEEAERRAAQANSAALLQFPNLVSTLDGFFKTHIFDPFIESEVWEALPEIKIVEESLPLPKDIVDDWAFKVPDLAKFPIPIWQIKCVLNAASDIEFKWKSGKTWSDVPFDRLEEIVAKKRALLLRGYATYNDVMFWCALICHDSDLRAAQIIASRFREVIVDEAQDTSSLQQSILQHLEAAGIAVSYVGDPEQCIFEFNDANPAYLTNLENSGKCDVWRLAKNYRATDKIVKVVNAHFGINMDYDRECLIPARDAYVCVGNAETTITRFESLIELCDLDPKDAAVIVKANDTLDSILGASNTDDLPPGLRLAIKAWQLERAGRYVDAADSALAFLRSTFNVVDRSLSERAEWRSRAWAFLRAWFPQPSEETCTEWVERLRSSVRAFAAHAGLDVIHNLNTVLQRKGLPETSAREFLVRTTPRTRASTIHGVKGESISSVLLWGTSRLHKKWLSLTDRAERSLLYVAFTRAQDLMVVGCPSEDIARQWEQRGFSRLQ